MLSKKMGFYLFLILSFLPGNFSLYSHADESKKLTTLAHQDFVDYKKSSFANPAYDPFVEEGFLALDRQDTTSSIEFLKKAVSEGCQSPLVYFKLALGYEAQGSYYSSLQYYELAGEQFKKSGAPHRYKTEFDQNYGRALYLSGEVDKAIPILEMSAKKTNSYWVIKLLGQIAFSKGDHDLGKTYYERALALNDPSMTAEEEINILLQLARACLKEGKTAQARKNYEKILQIAPSHEEAKSYLSGTKKIESQEKLFEIFDKH